MPITLFYFWMIIAGIVIVYYVLPKGFQWIVLLLSSVGLYIMFAEPKGVVFWMLAILVSYASALGMDYYKESQKKRRFIFWCSFIGIFGILFAFNYWNFIADNVNAVYGKIIRGRGISLPLSHWIAPLGISFYTLSLLSYVIDVYWKIQKPQRNILKFLLFGSYFPVMTSGPVLRYREIEEELYKKHDFNYQRVCFGGQRIVWGLFKKLVIADRIKLAIDNVFGNYADYNGYIILVVGVGAVVQLYFDFSACMDIVLGISETLDVKLPENFKKPFSSLTVAEFFRKWHITLGLWLKDYLYYPLMKTDAVQNLASYLKKKIGKKAGKRTATFTAMFILWFCNGLWHGGAWKFVLGIGIVLWLYILLGEITESAVAKICRKLQIDRRAKGYVFFQHMKIFFMFYGVTWFFYAMSFTDGIKMIKWTVVNFGWSKISLAGFLNIGLTLQDIILVIAGFMIVVVVSLTKGDIREKIAGKNLILRWGIYYGTILAVLIMSANVSDAAKGFIYAQF